MDTNDIGEIFGINSLDYDRGIAEVLKYQRETFSEEGNGWLTPNESVALFLGVKSVLEGMSGAILEIGSFTGRSTSVLLQAIHQTNMMYIYNIDTFEGTPGEHDVLTGKYYTVDHFDSPRLLHDFRKNTLLEGYQERALTLIGPSSMWADSFKLPLRFLFIDGDHRYDGVRRDIYNYVPLVQSGGIVCFHDFHWDGPRQATQEFMTEDKWDFLAVVDAIGIFRRK